MYPYRRRGEFYIGVTFLAHGCLGFFCLFSKADDLLCKYLTEDLRMDIIAYPSSALVQTYFFLSLLRTAYCWFISLTTYLP